MINHESGVTVEGVFRIPGSESNSQLLYHRFVQNQFNIDHVVDVHDVVTCLKRMLREAPETVLTNRLYALFADSPTPPTPQEIQACVAQLPSHTRELLQLLFQTLHAISENVSVTKMTYHNLEVCLMPMLSRKDRSILEHMTVSFLPLLDYFRRLSQARLIAQKSQDQESDEEEGVSIRLPSHHSSPSKSGKELFANLHSSTPHIVTHSNTTAPNTTNIGSQPYHSTFQLPPKLPAKTATKIARTSLLPAKPITSDHDSYALLPENIRQSSEADVHVVDQMLSSSEPSKSGLLGSREISGDIHAVDSPTVTLAVDPVNIQVITVEHANTP